MFWENGGQDNLVADHHHVQVHSYIQGLQSAGGVCGQAPLLAAHRARGHSAVCPESGGAAARRQSHSGFAQGEQSDRLGCVGDWIEVQCRGASAMYQ